jgi:hypothetical protein
MKRKLNLYFFSSDDDTKLVDSRFPQIFSKVEHFSIVVKLNIIR